MRQPYDKNVEKEIMHKSNLRKKHLKSISLTDRKNYNIQRNFCKKLLRSTKKRICPELRH